MDTNELTLIDRLKSPTSNFFKVIRTVGLTIAAVGGALIASPIALPATLVTLAGYLTVAGTVMTAVAQVTVQGE